MFTLVLVVATATVSLAQSGRGRQLRIQGAFRGESVVPLVADVEDDRKIDPRFSEPSPAETRSSTALIYKEAPSKQKKDNGENHMTKADKRAGWILLGLLVLAGISVVSQD
ncbi:MAG TPA: hypothetical protein VF899_01275 [Pyrinomonadaceae bacterium]